MNKKSTQLARRYAKAFLNLYGDQITQKDFEAICQGKSYFLEHKQIGFLMRLSLLDDSVKKKALDKLYKQFGLSDIFEPLLWLLVKNKHSVIFPELFEQLCMLYKKRNNIIHVAVSTVISLTDSQKKEIEVTLEKRLQKTVTCSYTLDSKLIAGIRLQSNQFLWEISIRQRLNRIKHLLAR